MTKMTSALAMSLHGNGAAIDIERELVSDARRDHAEPAVVIDVPGAERDARKFPHQVRFLGNQRRAAEYGDGILAVLRLNFPQSARCEVECFVPAGFAESRLLAHQRIKQAVGMVRLHDSALRPWAKLAVVERKLLPGLESYDRVPADLELNAALLAAEATMRLHEPFSAGFRDSLLPSARRE